MDVLDPADVVDGVHEDAAAQGLTLNVPDEVPFIACRVYTIIRIEQFDGENGGVLAPHGYGPRIWPGLLGGRLFRVINNDAFQSAVIVERDERRRVLAVLAFRHQEGRAFICRLGEPLIANTDVRGNGFPNAFQSDGIGHVQMASEKVITAGGLDDTTTGLAG